MSFPGSPNSATIAEIMRARLQRLLYAATVLAGCSAPVYQNAGPDFSAEPPKTVRIRVVGTGDATEPESVAIDGRFLCHNFDPGRRRLPRCPSFDADAGDKFELEAFVSVGEHRVSVVGWGEHYDLSTNQVFMPEVPVVCTFTFAELECIGQDDGGVLEQLERAQAGGAE